MDKCRECNDGFILKLKDTGIVIYKNNKMTVEVNYSICNSCDQEFIGKSQIVQNDINVRESRKIIDGLLSKEEILNSRTTLNITQEEASIIFGGGRNAFSKYERGEVSQSVSMDKLIRLCLESKITFDKLSAKSGVIKESKEPLWGETNVYHIKDYSNKKCVTKKYLNIEDGKKDGKDELYG